MNGFPDSRTIVDWDWSPEGGWLEGDASLDVGTRSGGATYEGSGAFITEGTVRSQGTVSTAQNCNALSPTYTMTAIEAVTSALLTTPKPERPSVKPNVPM